MYKCIKCNKQVNALFDGLCCNCYDAEIDEHERQYSFQDASLQQQYERDISMQGVL